MAGPEALRALLNDAYALLRRGEAADAERHAKAVSAVIRAERELAELASAQEQDQEEDSEAVRAEIIGRITRLIAAEHAGASDEVLERIAEGDEFGMEDMGEQAAAAARR